MHPITAPVLTVTSPLDPRTAAVMSPADNVYSFLLLLFLALERFFRNMFPSFSSFLFSLSFYTVCPSLSPLFVASDGHLGTFFTVVAFSFEKQDQKYTFHPPSMQATYGARTLNCEARIYFTTKGHPSHSFLFSPLLLCAK